MKLTPTLLRAKNQTYAEQLLIKRVHPCAQFRHKGMRGVLHIQRKGLGSCKFMPLKHSLDIMFNGNFLVIYSPLDIKLDPRHNVGGVPGIIVGDTWQMSSLRVAAQALGEHCGENELE